MNDCSNQTQPKPLPFWGGVGGGASQPNATPETKNKLHRPTPTPPLKGRGFTPQDDNIRLGEHPTQGRAKNWGIPAERLAELHARATEMRREPTEPEKRLWRALSRSKLGGYKFRRQSVIGPFIADFMCSQKGLIVEVDGHTHSDPTADARRDAKLAEMGFRVFRVTNDEMMGNIEGVCEALLALLSEMPSRFERPHPNPSPKGAGLKAAQELQGISLGGSVG